METCQVIVTRFRSCTVSVSQFLAPSKQARYLGSLIVNSIDVAISMTDILICHLPEQVTDKPILLAKI